MYIITMPLESRFSNNKQYNFSITLPVRKSRAVNFFMTRCNSS